MLYFEVRGRLPNQHPNANAAIAVISVCLCLRLSFFLSFQVGACIVNQENKIVGIGYNGMPNGCDDDLLPWSRSADNQLDTKYPYGI